MAGPSHGRRGEGEAAARSLEELVAEVARGRLGAVVEDHRRAGPGRVFVAIRGHRVDARMFAAAAARAGCAAVVARGPAPPDWPADTPCAWVRVGDDRRALSRLAAARCGHPSRDLGITAVTGTNGKTTVTYLLEAILRAADIPAGRIGTVEVKVGERRYPPALTTPDPLTLHRWLRRMRRAGVREVAMEASSHALAQRRIDDVAVDVAVLTNVRRDHLDYHRNHRAYRDAKGRLFTRVLAHGGPGAVAVLPAGEAAAALFAARTAADVVWYGLSDELAPSPQGVLVRGEDLAPRRWGTRLRLCLPEQTAVVDLPLGGRFNVKNALAAAAAARARGIAPEAIAFGLEAASGAPGRAEVVHDGEFAVLLDFAHNPDALTEILAMARATAGPGGRVLCVMGAEGDKDQGKRPLMGEAAGRGSDILFVTSDSPRSEEPERVAHQVASGARHTGAEVRVDPDRRRAIRAAILAACRGDVVVVAGRGPETVQVVGGRRLHWSDLGAIRAALALRDTPPEAAPAHRLSALPAVVLAPVALSPRLAPRG